MMQALVNITGRMDDKLGSRQAATKLRSLQELFHEKYLTKAHTPSNLQNSYQPLPPKGSPSPDSTALGTKPLNLQIFVE